MVESNEEADILATWGHEVRNPLSALSHVLDIWHDAVGDPHQMEELRAIIERQVRQLRLLSAELMEGTQITHGKLPSAWEPVDLKDVIREACEEVQPFIRRCRHTLSIEQCDEPTNVYGDRSRLLQVFANLIENAAKFTDPGGELAIVVDSRNAVAEVRIRDNGRGIEPDFLPRIFEKFAQIPGGGNDGVGLGLGLVKAIVQGHGGTVSARSGGVRQGSEFTVSLPLWDGSGTAEPSNQAAIGPSATPVTPANYQIVVVDDNPSLRMLLARLLSKLGHSVTVAHDGETAIRMVLQQRPQVVFLDLMMPGIDGYEVARRLRRQSELQGLTLIALSGSGSDTSRKRALEVGFNYFMRKPADITEIADTLAEITLRDAANGVAFC